MSYRIAGIDVHKKMLAVVVADVEVDGDFCFERQKVGTTPADLRRLAEWLIAAATRHLRSTRPPFRSASTLRNQLIIGFQLAMFRSTISKSL